MALQIVEFFGFKPLDPAATQFVADKKCPFINDTCSKPNHGACSVKQVTGEPVICCPNRIYSDNYRFLTDIAEEAFGTGHILLQPADFLKNQKNNTVTGNEVVVFGQKWGQELPLPAPSRDNPRRKQFYVDWILAKISQTGELTSMTAVEVQTIDTTGYYGDQAKVYFSGKPFTDRKGRTPGYSMGTPPKFKNNPGLNWENVNKRILPQVIYKGHVLRREQKCTKGLYFVCPEQVYNRIRERLGGDLHNYPKGPGTITFRSYKVGSKVSANGTRDIVVAGQFTTTVDQVALAFTSPQNLPDMGVYESAISKALSL